MKRLCDIKGLEYLKPCYFAIESGEIVSFSNKRGGLSDKPRKLKFSRRLDYDNCTLVDDDGNLCYFRVHRLIAMAFIGVPDNADNLLVHHKNGNKHDNRAENLEWITAKEHSREHNGKELYCYNQTGELVKFWPNAIDCTKEGYGFHAFNVARGIEKTHKGFVFSWEPLSPEMVFQRLSKTYPALKRRKSE